MPWLQLNDGCLWSTNENAVECFLLPETRRDTRQREDDRKHCGSDDRIRRNAQRTVRLARVGDVCRFIYRDNLIVAGTRCVLYYQCITLMSSSDKHQ